MAGWIYLFAGVEGEDREIGGLKVWKHLWQDQSENAVVIDPIYGQTHHFGVYRIWNSEKVVEFAAGEFSNGVWGFYARNPNAASI